jgi:hypothetical protein
MNFLKLSLITASLLLIGCGSSSDDGGSDAPEATTIEKAESNFKAFGGAMSSSQELKNQNTKMKQLAKTESGSCTHGGTFSMSLSEDETNMNMSFNNCKFDDTYIDGTMIMTEYDDYHYKMEMKNLTMKDSENDLYFKNLALEENELEYWSTIDGDMNINSKCFTGKYNFTTLERLIETQDASDNLESGKLKLNGAIYTFNNPNVTIEVAGKTKTILQTELDEQMTSETTCKE